MGVSMPADAFRIWTIVSAMPERVYSAWMDSGAHSAFTGGEAKIDPTIGGKFTAWDGYIQGRTIDLLQGRRIVQIWRTKEFPHGSPDSRVEIQLESADGGTRLTILHSNIPLGQGERYKQGWVDNYFQPMREYFGRLLAGPDGPPTMPPKKAAAAKPVKAPAKAAKAVPKPAPKKAPPKKVATKKAPPKKSAPKKSSPPKKKGK
jgi:uncharacterized protein YndB with AHSA1/START domain